MGEEVAVFPTPWANYWSVFLLPQNKQSNPVVHEKIALSLAALAASPVNGN